MPDGEKRKDWWDKADIVGKLLSGAVLAIVALVIKSGTDRIAAAQGRGDFVRQLVADLTTKDERTRQDIALIALNHSIGDENPQLVVDIAERLVADSSGYASADRAASQALSSVAFHILKQRDSVRADSMRLRLEQRFEAQVSDSAVRAAVRSSPDTGKQAIPMGGAVESSVQAAAGLLAPVGSSVIYVQFQGSEQREVAKRLRDTLSKAGFVTPGVELIRTPFASSVRYFFPEDKALADSVGRTTTALLREEQLNVGAMPVQYLAGRAHVRRRQLEVWISVH